MKKYEKLVLAFLILSGLLGIYILVEDALVGPPNRLLWADNWVWAPVPHATALVVMVVIDFVLVGLLLFRRPTTIVKVALVWGVLQFLAMVLNPLTGSFYVDAILQASLQSPEKIVPVEFRDFLLGMDVATREEFLRQVFNPQSFAAYLFSIPGFVARVIIEVLLIISAVLAIRAKSRVNDKTS